jgi:HK97 family phage major capsid protein
MTDACDQITESANAEERDLGPNEVELLQANEKRIVAIDDQIKIMASVAERAKAGMDVQHLLAQARKSPASPQYASTEVREKQPSLGDFIASDAYRNWAGRGNSAPHTVEMRASMLRAPLLESTAPGSLLLPTRPRYTLGQHEQLTPLLDAMTKLQVSQQAVDLIVYGSPKGATGAAVVPEGQAKPEGALTAVSTTINLDTIAVWVQASRQLLADAPAARGLIDDQLSRGVLTKLEAEAGAAIDGATYTTVTGASKQPLIDVVRIAVATLQAGGYRPNVVLCSPQDAAAFDLLLMSKTMLGAQMGMGVWGLQVIPVIGLTKPIVADTSLAFTHVERTGIQVFISDSHASTFVSNIFTILAEVRAKTVVTNAAAAVTITITP